MVMPDFRVEFHVKKDGRIIFRWAGPGEMDISELGRLGIEEFRKANPHESLFAGNIVIEFAKFESAGR